MDTYVYSIEDDAEHSKTLYVNLTNKCSNACLFCIRNTVDEIKGKNMWLEKENVDAKDVISQFENFDTPEEVVFCGYGEPFMKLDLLKEVAKYLKDNGIKVRVNTNGHGNFINKKSIVPEIKDLIDVISVSLNASNDEQYKLISKPKFENAFEEMKKFTKECVNSGIKTVMTVVDGYPDYTLDIAACEKVARSLGAEFRVREWIKNGY